MWVNHLQYNLNWASTLVAYDKPYLGQLPQIEELIWIIMILSKQLVENNDTC